MEGVWVLEQLCGEEDPLSQPTWTVMTAQELTFIMPLRFGSCFFSIIIKSEVLSWLSSPFLFQFQEYCLHIKNFLIAHKGSSQRGGMQVELKKENPTAKKMASGDWVSRGHLYSPLREQLMFTSQFKFRTLSISEGGFINSLVYSYISSASLLSI